MNYNLYFSGSFPTQNLFDLSEERLKKIVEAYLGGKKEFTFSGKKYSFNEVSDLKIFTNESGLNSYQLTHKLQDLTLFKGLFGNNYVDPKVLSKFGSDVTQDFIGDLPYGVERAQEIIVSIDYYVDPSRIEQLKNIKSENFDFFKLVQICMEINTNWQMNNYYTVGLLVRSIINHIPPVFGKYENFDQVIGQYGDRSFKKNMKALNESLRSTADSYTHSLIRQKEPMPTAIQVDYRQNLDVLLSEIIAVVK